MAHTPDSHEPTLAASPPPELPTAAPEPYEPPAIVYRAPLEVTAAFCDPNAGGKTPVLSCFTIINS